MKKASSVFVQDKLIYTLCPEPTKLVLQLLTAASLCVGDLGL